MIPTRQTISGIRVDQQPELRIYIYLMAWISDEERADIIQRMEAGGYEQLEENSDGALTFGPKKGKRQEPIKECGYI